MTTRRESLTTEEIAALDYLGNHCAGSGDSKTCVCGGAWINGQHITHDMVRKARAELAGRKAAMTTRRETGGAVGGWTPGPWKLDEQSQLIETASPNLKDEYEHICDFRADWNTEKINLANARLIAAAPELVEALEGLLVEFTGLTDGQFAHRPAYVQARAALAKARGEGL